MLNSRRLGLSLAVPTAAAVLLVMSFAGPAAAEPRVCYWVGEDYVCEVVKDPPPPGEGGKEGGSGGTAMCSWQGQWVRCWQDGWGWFNETDGCYYILEEPQPPAGDPAWEGHEPGDGAVWRQRCFGDVIGDLVWRASPPPGQPGTLSPAQLAARAIASMGLRAPQIKLVPDTGPGLVGLPVWLWTEVTPTTWGPNQITASVPGLAVTARAQATQIRWDMGDGNSVTCRNPGTPWKPSLGTGPSPTCGYTYSKPSRDMPGGKYTITATTTWVINWWVVGGGETGRETTTRTSTTTIDIDELQVVTR